jgi:hypothetical protein
MSEIYATTCSSDVHLRSLLPHKIIDDADRILTGSTPYQVEVGLITDATLRMRTTARHFPNAPALLSHQHDPASLCVLGIADNRLTFQHRSELDGVLEFAGRTLKP